MIPQCHTVCLAFSLFSQTFPISLVANIVDVVAKEFGHGQNRQIGRAFSSERGAKEREIGQRGKKFAHSKKAPEETANCAKISLTPARATEFSKGTRIFSGNHVANFMQS